MESEEKSLGDIIKADTKLRDENTKVAIQSYYKKKKN